MIAGEGIAREVCLYFSAILLRGNRSRKMSADGLVAFDSPGYPHLADVGISVKYNYSAILPPREGGLKYHPFAKVPIGVLKVFPGIQFGLFEDIMTEKLSGIVLETFGAGNIPMGNGELLPIIKKAFAAGTVIAVCSQCPSGTVTLGAYETSSELKRAGAVSGGDMTTEAGMYAYIFHEFYASRMVYYLNLTLLIGYATLYPDAQFLIFFVIPVRAWILGLLYLLLNAIELFNLMVPEFLFPHCLFPLVGFGSYILYFGSDIKNLLPPGLRMRATRGYRRAAPKKTGTVPFRPAQPSYTHKCTVCGRTDVSNPELEFRYCSRCSGYHCYCQEHIDQHTHITES
jgi:hypothetical protein